YKIWKRDFYRPTYDVDTAVAVDFDDFPGLVDRLVAEGWKQEPKREHRWHTPEGARIDLPPAGPALRRQGHLEWPISRVKMSLVGFEHVFKDAVQVEVADDLIVKVIPVVVLALLKIVAYMDNPYERARDVQDLAVMLTRHEPRDDLRFSEEILNIGLDYEAV